MKTSVKVITFFILPVSVALLLLEETFSSKVEPGFSAAQTKTVEGVPIRQVTESYGNEGIAVTGSVVPAETARISAKVMATVIRM